MDVVDARAEDWTLPPFKFIEKDGYFYGRGTSDMKDEDAAMAASIIRLRKEGYVPDRDIIAAFTADEEVGLDQDGPAYLLKNTPKLVNAGLVINPDGGSGEILDGKRLDFSVETAQKTYMTFTMEVTNKGGHSSEPRPDNAIYELANGLVKLSHYDFPFKTNATTRNYFRHLAERTTGPRQADLIALSRLPLDVAAAKRAARDVANNAILHTTCVATMLAAGVQENALPSRATATIQCRVFPDETIASVRKTLETVVADPGIKVSLLGAGGEGAGDRSRSQGDGRDRQGGACHVAGRAGGDGDVGGGQRFPVHPQRRHSELWRRRRLERHPRYPHAWPQRAHEAKHLLRNGGIHLPADEAADGRRALGAGPKVRAQAAPPAAPTHPERFAAATAPGL